MSSADISDDLDKAVEHLLTAVEKHRLLFLYLAMPQRLKGGNRGWDTLDRNDWPQHRIPIDDVDNEGEFLFRHRFALDTFAQRAISQFGPGEGFSPRHVGTQEELTDVQSRLPFWSLNELDCVFMERSGDDLLAASKHVLDCDSSGTLRPLVEKAIANAHDNGEHRWYSPVLVRWCYLADLDEVIGDLKKAIAGVFSKPHVQTFVSSAGKVAPAVEEAAQDAEATSKQDAEKFKTGFPLAFAAALGIRELDEMQHLYPDNLNLQEIASLRQTLTAWIETTLSGRDFEQIRALLASGTTMNRPAAILLLPPPVVATNDIEIAIKQIEELGLQGHRQSPPHIQDVFGRITEIELCDCRVPHPKNDPAYQQPLRHAKALKAYWKVLRQVVIHQADALISFKPHPLLPIIINAKARIAGCLNGLGSLAKTDETGQRISSLIDAVLSGDPDELSVVPEYTLGEVAQVDAFIEETILASGSTVFALTRAEQAFLKVFQTIADEYKKRVKESWARLEAKSIPEAKAYQPTGTPATQQQAQSGKTPPANEPAEQEATQALRLPNRMATAYAQYQRAETALAEEGNNKPIDQECYDWLKSHNDGDTLPASDTWQRYVGGARKHLGQQKNTPRAGRDVGRSIVLSKNIEPPTAAKAD